MIRKIFSVVLIFALTLSTAVANGWWCDERIEDEAGGHERVTLIVELEGGGVLERAKGGASLFKDGFDDRNIKSTVKSAQTLAKDVLTNSIDCEVVGALDYVKNALFVETTSDKIEKIENLDGVEKVYISKMRYIVEPVECESVMDLGRADLLGIEQRDAIALDKLNGDYDGEGLVVGIIDSELWYDHSAFSVPPQNPRFFENDIDEVLNSGSLKAETLLKREMTSADVYKSAKVPFAFDYANKDTDPKADPKVNEANNKNYHGTHVAGIAAAKSEMLSGLAPESQIVFAKVCSDGTNAMQDTVVCQALDDFARLKPDIINISLGSDSGFSDSDLYESFFQTLEDAGIALSVSAGNSGRIGDRFDYGAPLTSLPDYGTVASPSTLSQAVSVASLSTDIKTDSIYEFTLEDGSKLEYYDSSHFHTAARMRTALEGTMTEYVDCKMGLEAHYKEAGELNGKIAVVTRGGDSIQNLFSRAEKRGAVGVILINTEGTPNSINLESCGIPSAIVSPQNGVVLKAAATKKLTSKSGSYIMSAYSARGTTPDLKLKPEITAVGDKVLSAAYDNGYAYMSGTSMASPQYSGAYLLTIDYINKNLNPLMPQNEKKGLATQLLASTATICQAGGGERGIFETPRAQGAGVINLEKMTKTPAVIVNTYDEKTKIELGEIGSSVFTASFKIKNISARGVTYNLSADIGCDDYAEKTVGGSTEKIVDGMRKLKAEISFSTGPDVTIPANDEKTVVLTATLDMTELNEMKEVFTNGFFVDGFIRCSNEQDPEISIPFTGFYGDWGALPIFGNGQYGLKDIVIRRNFNSVSSGNSLRTDTDGIFYYSPNTGFMGAALQPLRNIKSLQFKVYDEKDNLLYTETANDIRKANKSSTGSIGYSFVGKFSGEKDKLKIPDGTLRMEILAVPDWAGAENQCLSYNIYMDSVYPSIEDISLKSMTVNGINSRWLLVKAIDLTKDSFMVGLENSTGKVVGFQYSTKDGTQLMNAMGYTLPSCSVIVEDLAQNRISLPISSRNAYIGEYDGKFFKGITIDSVFVSGGFILDRHDIAAPSVGQKKIFVWDENLKPVAPGYIVE